MMAIQVDEIETQNNDDIQPLPEGVLWKVHGSLGQDDLDYYSVVVGEDDKLNVSIRPDPFEYEAGFDVTIGAYAAAAHGIYIYQRDDGEWWLDDVDADGKRFQFTSSIEQPRREPEAYSTAASVQATFTHRDPDTPLESPVVINAAAAISATFSLDNLAITATTQSLVSGELFSHAVTGLNVIADVSSNYSGIEIKRDMVGSEFKFERVDDPEGIGHYEGVVNDFDVDDEVIWRYETDSTGFDPYAILISPSGDEYDITSSVIRIDDPTPGTWKIGVSKDGTRTSEGDDEREYKRPYTLDVSLGPVDLSVTTSGGLADDLDEVFVDFQIDGILPESPTTTIDLYWAKGPLSGDVDPNDPLILEKFDSIQIDNNADASEFRHTVTLEELAEAPADATHLVAIADPYRLLADICRDNNAMSAPLIDFVVHKVEWNTLRHEPIEQQHGHIWRGVDIDFEVRTLGDTAREIPVVPEIQFYWSKGPTRDDVLAYAGSTSIDLLYDLTAEGQAEFYVPMMGGHYYFNDPARFGNRPSNASHLLAITDFGLAIDEASETNNIYPLYVPTPSEILGANPVSYIIEQSGIQISFAPANQHSLSAAEVALGIDHFNWLQVYYLPANGTNKIYRALPGFDPKNPYDTMQFSEFVRNSVEPSFDSIPELSPLFYVESYIRESDQKEFLHPITGNLRDPNHDRSPFYLNEIDSGGGGGEWQFENTYKGTLLVGGTATGGSMFAMYDRPTSDKRLLEHRYVSDPTATFKTYLVGVLEPTVSRTERADFEFIVRTPVIWESDFLTDGSGSVTVIRKVDSDEPVPTGTGGIKNVRFRPLGDYDLNGYVDSGDYSVWKGAFGSTVALAGEGADGNFDGIVNSADYTVWRNNLGAGTPPQATGAGALAVDIVDVVDSSAIASVATDYLDVSPTHSAARFAHLIASSAKSDSGSEVAPRLGVFRSMSTIPTKESLLLVNARRRGEQRFSESAWESLREGFVDQPIDGWLTNDESSINELLLDLAFAELQVS